MCIQYLVYTEELTEQLKKYLSALELTSTWEMYTESHVISINTRHGELALRGGAKV